MSSSFEKLPDEKRRMILEICIEEFAVNGFENASTNKITQRAGISKGLLFHYFKNKKGLYLYLFEHSMQLIADNVYKKLQNIKETDFFDRIRQVTVIKLNVCLIYTHEYQLLMKSILDTPKELQKEIERTYENYYKTAQEANEQFLFSYLDECILRPGLTKEFAVEYVMNVLDQLTRNMLQVYKGKEKELLVDPDPFLEKLNRYFDVIQYGVYQSVNEVDECK